MRVLQLLSSSAFHGAESMAAELSRQLAALGVHIELAVFDNAGRGNAEIFERVGPAAAATHRIDCSGPFDPRAVARLRRLLRERRIDVVHSHKYKGTFYALAARAGLPCRVVTTYHNWLLDTRALRAYAALDKRVARFNDLCVGVSTPVTEELRRWVPGTRVQQIDNGVDVARFHPPLDRAPCRIDAGGRAQRPLVGMVGRLSAEKGVFDLLDAVSALPDTFDVSIVGDGPLRTEIEARIEAGGLQARVRLLGNRRDVEPLYRGFDVFVLSSRVEAFPMALLEAMSSGCASIATRVGEVPRMVDDGVTGLLVPVGDTPALTQALSALLTSPERVTALGLQARSAVVERFSAQRMARAYLDAYESCLRPRR